jgi:hypothetical protein
MQQQQKIPNEQLAQVALAFIERTQISAQEAESMVVVKNWLRGMAQPAQTGGDGDGERVPNAPRLVGVAGEPSKDAA